MGPGGGMGEVGARRTDAAKRGGLEERRGQGDKGGRKARGAQGSKQRAFGARGLVDKGWPVVGKGA
jgi:hypothetical protein